MAGALARGKVSREVLEEVFGPSLLGVVEAARRKEEQLSATVRKRLQSLAKRNKAAGRRRSSSSGGESKVPEKKHGDFGDEEDDDDDDVFREFLTDELAGDGDTPGKLQVSHGEEKRKNELQQPSSNCKYNVCLTAPAPSTEVFSRTALNDNDCIHFSLLNSAFRALWSLSSGGRTPTLDSIRAVCSS